MSIDANGRAHTPAGLRTGGQFATEPRAEADVALMDDSKYDFTEGLGVRGVPAGMLSGIDTFGRHQLLDEIENRGLDRDGARELVMRYQEWRTMPESASHLDLGRAMRLRSEADTQIHQALAVRNGLRGSGELDRIREAEEDVWGAWKRYDLACEDLRALAGEPVRDSDSIVRAGDPNYPGQLMPYPSPDLAAGVPNFVFEMGERLADDIPPDATVDIGHGAKIRAADIPRTFPQVWQYATEQAAKYGMALETEDREAIWTAVVSAVNPNWAVSLGEQRAMMNARLRQRVEANRGARAVLNRVREHEHVGG